MDCSKSSTKTNTMSNKTIKKQPTKPKGTKKTTKTIKYC